MERELLLDLSDHKATPLQTLPVGNFVMVYDYKIEFLEFATNAFTVLTIIVSVINIIHGY